MTAPELRTGPLEWAWQAASGRLEGVAWVDDRLLDRARAFSVVREGDEVRFRHVAYGAFLPPPMLEAAQEAAERGEPTALQGLLLLFARVEWLVRARSLLWRPYGPVPELLVPLVEAYGVDGALHRGDPAAIASLLAHLPHFYPSRGRADRALALLDAALDEEPPVRLAEPGSGTEAFACRGASWWAARGAQHGELRIEAGVVRLSRVAAPPTTREDVALAWDDDRFPHEILRLLPAWSTVRLFSERSR